MYIGRFAPSPTGPLHAGSLVAALASWLDARAHGGRWLVRVEDVDGPRTVLGMDRVILHQLAACGMVGDGDVMVQSTRGAVYQAALDALVNKGLAYPCTCSRKAVEAAQAAQGRVLARGQEAIYPGTCRSGLWPEDAHKPKAWRLRTQGDVEKYTGDFVLRRADGCWAYQLAVVVDDAAQGVTHVVRGRDLLDNTPRQQYLQQCLSLPLPEYLHTPLVLAADGEKLSKQNGTVAVNIAQPLQALHAAAQVLGLPPHTGTAPEEVLTAWLQPWRALRQRYGTHAPAARE